MRRPHAVASLVLIASVALGWEIGGADPFGHRKVVAGEVARLRLHFAEVEREMLARDISDLSPAQRAARTEQMRLLRDYAAREEFPRNTWHPGQRVPYFRDADGTLCAMAFLIAASGRGDLVDRVARTRNNATIPELADEPGLAQWLEDHGLTLSEAARIQPSYDDGTCCVLDDPPPAKPSARFLAASAGVSALSGLSIAWNMQPAERVAARRWAGVLGAGMGGANLLLGLSRLGSDGWENQVSGIWNVAIGTTAAILGVRALVVRPRTEVRSARGFELTPAVGAGARPSVGFVGRVRF